MPKQINITLNDKQINREIKRLSKRLERESKGGSKKAMSRVLTRAAQSLKTQTVKRAAPKLEIKQKYIRPRVKVIKANSNKMRSGIWVGANNFNALSIGARQTDDGYTVGPYTWSNAFKWQTKKGKEILLQRKGRQRYPLQTASLGQTFVERELKSAADSAMNVVIKRDLKADLQRELRFRLSKFLNVK